jgi:ABC transporter DrrB family efflux protein
VAAEPAAVRELIGLTGQFAAVDELLTGRENLEMFGRLFKLSGDRIAVIDHGKVIAEGTGNELKDRVGGQILEVALASAGQRDQAQAVLAGVGCGEPEPDERPDRLTLPAPRNGLQLVEEAAAGLRRAQIGVSDIGLRRPTLDDVFLQLTGAPPGEDGGGPGPRTRPRPRPRRRQPAPDAPAPRRPVLRLRRPRPQAVRSAITDTAVVTGRNLRHFIRQPDLLVFSTIQPVLFVLLFVYVFGGAISRSLAHGVAYVDFLLPGIFVQSVTFGASQTAVGLKEDLTRGVVDRFRSMPMARSAVLAGRTVADLVRNIAIIGLMIAVGYLVGFRFLGGVAGAVGCIAVVAAFGLALSWIFAFVALTVRGAETAQTAGFVVIFPLVFASSVFVPVSTFPDWLQTFAKINPVTVTANAARSLALYGTPASLGAAAAWIGGLLAVFIPLSVWRYRRIS